VPPTAAPHTVDRTTRLLVSLKSFCFRLGLAILLYLGSQRRFVRGLSNLCHFSRAASCQSMRPAMGDFARL
jgi:hypothetical protein